MKWILFIVLLINLNPNSEAATQKVAASKIKTRKKTLNPIKSKDLRFRGGNIYELNSDKKKLLFTMEADLKKPTQYTTIFSSAYFDTEKNEVMTEEASFDHLNLQKYVIYQKQLNEKYELEILEGKMFFSVTKNGEVEKKTRDLTANLLIGPSFVPFLQQRWVEIQAYKKVEAALAVVDHMDTFSFQFEKIRDEKLGSKNTVIVRMKPVNTLVSSLVRPVYFVVEPDGSRIIELKGRMLPKRKVNDRWEDFEGEAVFTY